MSLQFNAVAVFLAVLIVLGVLSHNNSVTISAAVLLVIQQTLLSQYLPWVEKYGLTVGIIILTIGVLAPIVSGKIQLPAFSELLNWKVILAILTGVLVAWFGGRGVGLLATQPMLITGLIIGTIIGVAFLGGVPVGPLIAAGILSLFIGKG